MVLTYAHGIYTLKTEQVLPITMEEAWSFFSDPNNLQQITPDDLNFKLTPNSPEPMFPGQIISYRIKIFPFYSSNWVTEITHVVDKVYFIDEQRFGPYKMWHHRHFFVDLKDQVLMFDEVNFKLPFGLLGRIFFPIIVKPKLKHIFAFRKERLQLFFKSQVQDNKSTTKPEEKASF